MPTPNTEFSKLCTELLDIISQLNKLPSLTADEDGNRIRGQLNWRAQGIVASGERISVADGILLKMIYSGFLGDGNSVLDCYDKLKEAYCNDHFFEINSALALRFCGLLEISNEHLLDYYNRTHSVEALKTLSDGYLRSCQYYKGIRIKAEADKLGVELDESNNIFFSKADNFVQENGIEYRSLLTYSENLHSFLKKNSVHNFNCHPYIQYDGVTQILVQVVYIQEVGLTHNHFEHLNEAFIDSVLDLDLPPKLLSKVVTKFKTPI